MYGDDSTQLVWAEEEWHSYLIYILFDKWQNVISMSGDIKYENWTELAVSDMSEKVSGQRCSVLIGDSVEEESEGSLLLYVFLLMFYQK